MLTVRVLGPLEVTADGTLVNVGGPRLRSVLGRLIAASGQVVSADRLIEDLYAGAAPAHARSALQSHVSRLRRALDPQRASQGAAPRAAGGSVGSGGTSDSGCSGGADGSASVIAAVPPGYAVRLAEDAVDAWVFADEVRAAADASNPAEAHALLTAALALWRGAAFAEFAGAPWADLEASRLAELRLTALEAQADAALRLGRAARTVPDLERLTAEHPLREEAWRLLALALYQSARQADALAALRRVRKLLADELGVDPGPALRALETGILAQDPRLTATAGLPATGWPASAADVAIAGGAGVPRQPRHATASPAAGAPADASASAAPAPAAGVPAAAPEAPQRQFGAAGGPVGAAAALPQPRQSAEPAAGASAGDAPGDGPETPQRRIAALDEGTRTLLLRASVIGIEADVGVLADVGGTEESALFDALDDALASGLVTEPEPGRIRFADERVRDALYGNMSQTRRSRLHAQAAAALERREPDDVAALARHFAQAGTDPVRAARYCVLSARQAEDRFAYHEAATLREQALEFLDQIGAPDWSRPDAVAVDRLELILDLVRVFAHDGQLAAAHSLRWHAVRAAQRHGDPELLARVLTAGDVPRALFLHEDGAAATELALVAEKLLRELPRGDHPLRCRLLTTLAIELEDFNTERGQEAAAEAMAMARRLGDRDVLATALMGCWLQSFHGGGHQERLKIGAELLTLSGGSATVQASARGVLMAASCDLADFRAADWHAAEAERIAQRYRLPTVGTAIAMYRAMRTALNGDPAGAAERYRDVARQVRGFGLRFHSVGIGAAATAALTIAHGKTAELAADPAVADWFPEVHALGLAAAGQLAEARAVANRPVPIAHGRGWLFMSGISGLLGVAIDDRDRAESAYRALLPHAGQPAGAGSLLVTLWPVAQILGDLATYLALPGADAHYRQALAIGERAGVASWQEAAARHLR